MTRPANATDADAETPLRIGFVLTPGMLVTGTALPYEMWQAVVDRQRASRAAPGVALHLVDGGLTGSAPLGLRPDCTLDSAPAFDVIYLPALWRNPRTVLRGVGDALGQWLRGAHAAGAQLAASSTGVSLLAASGLLDGRAATTHWANFDRFEHDFPDVSLKREYFITQSGTLYCAASINSLADVTVHLIERFVDRTTAHHVERNFSHEIRRTYAEYRYLDGGTPVLHDESALDAQNWIRDNLASEVTVAELAARLGTTQRTLERRFRNATGNSVRAWWQEQRVLLAKELLEKTNLAIGDIAWRVGYRDAGYFSRLFQRVMRVSPTAYRATVRKKLFRSAAGAPAVKVFDNAGTR